MAPAIPLLEVELQGSQGADDLFLARLAGSRDAMAGQAGEVALVDQFRWRSPFAGRVIQIELLEQCRAHQHASPAEEARALGAVDRLAAAEGNQIGAFGDEAAKV